MRFEALERRALFAADLGSLQNADNPFDTNNDGGLSPADALVIINYLQGSPDSASEESPVWADVTGNGLVDELDVQAIFEIHQMIDQIFGGLGAVVEVVPSDAYGSGGGSAGFDTPYEAGTPLGGTEESGTEESGTEESGTEGIPASYLTPPSGSGSGSGSVTVVTSVYCKELPQRAGPSFFILPPGGDIQTPNPTTDLPGWDLEDDAGNGAVVIGDDTDVEPGTVSFPTDWPGTDESFIQWMEVTGSRAYTALYEIYNLPNASTSVNQSVDHGWMRQKSHTRTDTGSLTVELANLISGKISGELGEIGAETKRTLSGNFTTSFSTTDIMEEQGIKKLSAGPCETMTFYQAYDVVEVQLKYVAYLDSTIGWIREPGALDEALGNPQEFKTLTLRSTIPQNGFTSRKASGKVVTETYPMPTS